MAALNLTLALPEAILAGATLLLVLLAAFLGERSFRLIAGLSFVALVAAILAILSGAGDGLALNGFFLVDPFGRFAKILVLAAAAVVLPMALDFAERHQMARPELPILLLAATLGMAMMISANDLIALYVALELQSLALYVAAALRRDDLRSTEAGLKYFVLGALSSGLLLYGASLVYGAIGATGFSAIAAAVDGGASGSGLLLGLVFLAVGLAFKIAAVPFHMWTPDVYEGAPTPVTAFFAAVPKVAALALFTRLLIGPFGGMSEEWRQILVFIAAASMILGAVAAVQQRNIKRLMAYSSIGNIGYALIGLAAGSAAGVAAMLVYMAIYVLTTVGSFAVILMMRREGRMTEDIADLSGLSRSRPGLAYALAIFMFSLAGIPPMLGFFAKVFVFMAAVDAGLYTLAIIGVLASVVGAFYYIRIVKVMFFDAPAAPFDRPAPLLRGIAFLAAAAVLLGILAPMPLQSLAAAAAASLF